MRKFLSVSFVAVLTAVTAGCECWNCLCQFEACKNQALFGQPSLFGTYNNAGFASSYDCGGVVADCGGMVVQSPIVSNCAPACGAGGCGAGGCGAGGCGPSGCDAGAGMIVSPGQTFVAPGQVVAPGQMITPVPTVVPSPETYAPSIR